MRLPIAWIIFVAVNTPALAAPTTTSRLLLQSRGDDIRRDEQFSDITTEGSTIIVKRGFWSCFGCGLFIDCEQIGNPCSKRKIAKDRRNVHIVLPAIDPTQTPGETRHFGDRNIVAAVVEDERHRQTHVRLQRANTLPSDVRSIAFDASILGTSFRTQAVTIDTRSSENNMGSVDFDQQTLEDATRATRSTSLRMVVNYQLDEL